MSSPFRILLILLLACACGGCGLLRKRGKGPPQPTGPNIMDVGTVDLVNDVQDFVIIHAPGRVTLKPGTVLAVMSADGPKAKLKLTPERKGSYLTADIVSGTPVKGEHVIWQEGGSPNSASPDAVTSQQETPSASISPQSAETLPYAPLPTASISPSSTPPL